MAILRKQHTPWLTAMIVACLGTPAAAVSPVGAQMRVDVDPQTAFYAFGRYFVAPTSAGGFAVAWEEDSVDDPPESDDYEAIRFRVFRPNLSPVAVPGKANLAALKDPFGGDLVRIGAGKVLVVFTGTRNGKTEAYGQTLSIADGSASPRALLNNTPNNDVFNAKIAPLSDGRAVFAWVDNGSQAKVPARFISPAGAPLVRNLDLKQPGQPFFENVYPFGAGFISLYSHNTPSFERYVQIFRSDGSKIGALKKVPHGAIGVPLVDTLTNSRVVVREIRYDGNGFKIIGTALDQSWSIVAGPKILQTLTNFDTARVSTSRLPGGAFLLVIVKTKGATTTFSISRFGSNLALIGPTYTFAGIAGDFPRVAALNGNRAVLVFTRKVSGRARLVAQQVEY